MWASSQRISFPLCQILSVFLMLIALSVSEIIAHRVWLALRARMLIAANLDGNRDFYERLGWRPPAPSNPFGRSPGTQGFRLRRMEVFGCPIHGHLDRQLDPQRISRILPSSPDSRRTSATCTRLNVTSDCFRPQDPEALYLQARRFAAPRAACLRS